MMMMIDRLKRTKRAVKSSRVVVVVARAPVFERALRSSLRRNTNKGVN